MLVAYGPSPGWAIWDKVAALQERVPTLETVVQVRPMYWIRRSHVPAAVTGPWWSTNRTVPVGVPYPFFPVETAQLCCRLPST